MDKSEYKERYEAAVAKLVESPEVDINFCREIYWQLRAEYVNYGRKINRWSIYSVVSVCLFLLLNRNLVGSATVLGIRLDHLGFLAYFMPPALSFCVLNIATSADEQGNSERLMFFLAKAKLPGLHASKISMLFTSDLTGLSSSVPDEFQTRLGVVSSNLYESAQILLYLVGYVGFEIYAYVYLFNHLSGIAAAVSMFATALIAAMTLLRFAAIVTDPAF